MSSGQVSTEMSSRSAWPIGSSHLTLAADLWLFAATLVGLSFAGVALLMLVGRAYRAAVAARATRIRMCRQSLMQFVLASCAQPKLTGWRIRSSELAAAILQLTDIVRGDERDRLLAEMDACGGFEQLAKGAARGSRRSRSTCLEAIAAFPLDRSEGVLRQCVRRGDHNIRLVAIGGMLAAGAAISPADLIQAASSGHLPVSLRFMRLLQTAAQNDPVCAVRLLECDELKLSFQIMLADALGNCAERKAAPILIQKAASPSSTLRAVAVLALGRIGMVTAESAIARALNDRDWRVRRAGLEAVALVGLKTTFGQVAARLADPVWAVRREAVATLFADAALGRVILKKEVEQHPDQDVHQLARALSTTAMAR